VKDKGSHTTRNQGATGAGVCSSSDRQDKDRVRSLRSVSTPRRRINDLTSGPVGKPERGGNGPRLVKHGVLMEPALWERVRARAEAEKVEIATLVRDLLRDGLDVREVGPGGMGRTKADHLLELTEGVQEELRDQAALLGAVGRAALGVEQLLVHWATREGSLGLSEEELFAELQVLGADGWSQVLEELRTKPEPSSAGS